MNAAERHDGALPLGHIADHDRTFGALARDRHTVEAFPGFGIQAANGPEGQQKQENPFHGYSSFSMIRSGRAQLREPPGDPPGKAHGAASGSTSASGRTRRFSGAGCAAADTATKQHTIYICNGCVSNRGEDLRKNTNFDRISLYFLKNSIFAPFELTAGRRVRRVGEWLKPPVC
ncbi:MAG: hypothetical protein ACLRMJ_10860 [Alistipes finegoldii]